LAFTIPNVGVAGFPDQSEPDSVDIDILTAGHSMTGVVSGCAVTAQGSPDMTVAVASGTISVLGVNQAVTSGNVTITAAHATLPRKDIVVVNSSGTKSVTAGTAATQPLKPAIPANSVVLAEIYVPALDTTINTNQITDKRVIVQAALSTAGPHLIARKTSDQSVTSSTTLVDCTSMGLPVLANEIWKVEFSVVYQTTTTGDIKIGFTFPTGGETDLNAAWGDNTGAFAIANWFATTSPTPSKQLYGDANRNHVLITGIYVNGANAGTLQLQFAQATSDATATTVKANSTVWGVKLA
jgi:hypothetical protein